MTPKRVFQQPVRDRNLGCICSLGLEIVEIHFHSRSGRNGEGRGFRLEGSGANQSVYILYNLLLWTFSLGAFPVFLTKVLFFPKRRYVFAQKFGFLPRQTWDRMRGEPRIWVHAVSLGGSGRSPSAVPGTPKSLSGSLFDAIHPGTESRTEDGPGSGARSHGDFFLSLLTIPLWSERSSGG